MHRGWIILLWAVIGGVVGQLVGTALAAQVPLLDRSIALGFDPTHIDLSFLVVTLGIRLRLSIGGAVGLVAALWLALRNA